MALFDNWSDKDLDENIAAKKSALEARRGDRNINNWLGGATNEIDSLIAEKERRAQASQKNELDNTLNDGGGLTSQSFEDMFRNGLESGKNTINESFIPQRQQAIEEAGVTGMLRQPGLLSAILAGIDTRKGNALRDLSLGLEGQKFGLNESRLNNQRTYNLARAGLNQGGNQFQQTFGLQKDQFGEQKRQNSMEDMFNQMTLDQAAQAGRDQKEANKPGTLDYLNTAFGGLSSLGKLAGGAGTAYTAFKGKK